MVVSSLEKMAMVDQYRRFLLLIESLGRSAPNRGGMTKVFITTYPEKSINRAYLVHALRWMNLGKRNNGSAQPVVSGKKIYPLPFPLPPLAEQKRIVAKLEELLPLCD